MDALVTIKGTKKKFSETFKNVLYLELNWQGFIEIGYLEHNTHVFKTIDFSVDDAVEIKRF